MNDLRYAFRSLRRSPGFTVLASLTLALGIGANAAIFNVAWQVLLKPLPFPNEDRLVVIWSAYGPNRRLNPVAPANYYDWVIENRSFESIAAFNLFSQESNLTGTGEPQQIRLVWVTEDFFRVLSIAPLIGRPILPSDATDNAGNVIVLSERLWRSAFGSDRAAVGRSVTVDGELYEIVGVMPDAAVVGTQTGDAWVRLPLRVERGVRQAHFLSVIARMRPGVTLAQTTDDVVAISDRSAREFPSVNAGLSARVVSLREHLAGGVRPTMLVLLGSAALVLLIACANIAGLQLARELARRREAAIRAAIGASRDRLVRSVLCEGFLLSLPGGYFGLLIAVWVVVTLKQLAPAIFAREIAAYPDLTVLVYTTAIAVVSGVAFAAIPAWRSASTSVQPALQSRSGATEPGASRLRTLLVGVEVALAVVVLDPNLPVTRILTSEQVLSKSLDPRRFNMLLLSGYAIVALALCSVGIYGLLTQIVGQRTHEIGVRMALGAHTTDVVRQILRGTGVGVAVGAMSGLAAAGALSGFVRHMLFGVSPVDPGLYASVVAIVLVVAFAAAYAPARRATRIDPVIALRTQ